jgi:hypothetical protein
LLDELNGAGLGGHVGFPDYNVSSGI